MKIDLHRVRFIAPVSPLTSTDVEAKGVISLSLEDDFVRVRNSTPGHAVPTALVPLSNVAFLVPKPEGKPEVKK